MSALKKLYRIYRGPCAKKRDIPFDLDFETFGRVTSSPCFYCGAEPASTMRSQSKRVTYQYNGVDRLDNTQGYVLGNVVACCKQCNFSKREQSAHEFMTWALRMALHLQSGGWASMKLGEHPWRLAAPPESRE